MNARTLDSLLRDAPSPSAAEATPDFTADVLREITAGRDPWREGWRKWARWWWPAAALAALLTAGLLVAALPHGSHETPAAPARVTPEDSPL